MKNLTSESVRENEGVNVKNLVAFLPFQVEKSVIAVNIIIELEKAFSAKLTLDQKDEAEKELNNAKDAQGARQAMQRITQKLLKNSKAVR